MTLSLKGAIKIKNKAWQNWPKMATFSLPIRGERKDAVAFVAFAKINTAVVFGPSVFT